MAATNVRPFVISTQSGTSVAVKQLLSEAEFARDFIFGLDCEWDAVLRRNEEEIPDLLQLGRHDGYCALFRLNHLEKIPSDLKSILEDVRYIKVGVGVQEDAIKLQRYFNVRLRGVLDLRYVARQNKIQPKGLRYLASQVLGMNLKKLDYREHKWSGKLDEKKKMYAALDAVTGVRIFDKLNLQSIYDGWGSKSRQWSSQQYCKTTFKLWKKYLDIRYYDHRSGL